MQVEETRCLVLNTDQIISQLFNDLGSFTGLNARWVVSNKDRLLGSHTNNTFCIVSTVNTSIICSQQHEFLSLDVQTITLQPRWVVKTLSDLLYLIGLQRQATRSSPDRVSCSRVYYCSVNFASSQKVISVSYIELVTILRDPLKSQCSLQTTTYLAKTY